MFLSRSQVSACELAKMKNGGNPHDQSWRPRETQLVRDDKMDIAGG